MNHWWVKRILHLVPSKNLYIWFCYISLHLPIIGQNLISAGHWDQYIILHLKLLQWHWGMGPSVNHVLEVLEWFYMLTEKILFQNRGLSFFSFLTPPPVCQKGTIFSVFFWAPSLRTSCQLGKHIFLQTTTLQALIFPFYFPNWCKYPVQLKGPFLHPKKIGIGFRKNIPTHVFWRSLKSWSPTIIYLNLIIYLRYGCSTLKI